MTYIRFRVVCFLKSSVSVSWPWRSTEVGERAYSAARSRCGRITLLSLVTSPAWPPPDESAVAAGGGSKRAPPEELGERRFAGAIVCKNGPAPPAAGGHYCLLRLEIIPNYAKAADGSLRAASRLTVRATHPAVAEGLAQAMTASLG